jgi:hypothetical protein
VNPDSYNPYPDHAFQVNPNPDPDPIRIQGFDDQKMKKKIQLKFSFIFFDQKLQFTYPYASGRPSYRKSLQPQNKTSST